MITDIDRLLNKWSEQLVVVNYIELLISFILLKLKLEQKNKENIDLRY